jgi:hypothetical protein
VARHVPRGRSSRTGSQRLTVAVGYRSTSIIVAAALLAGACSTDNTAGGATTQPNDVATTAAPDSTLSATTSLAPAATSTITPTTIPTPTTTILATNTTTASTTTTVQEYPLAAERELAQLALITIDLFPEGWVEVSNESGDDEADDEEFQEEFNACLGVTGEGRVSDTFDERSVEGPTFEDPGSSSTVEQTVIVTEAESVAIAAMEEIGFEGASDCLARVLTILLRYSFAADLEAPPGLIVGDLSVERLPSTLPADVVFEYLVTIPFEIAGETANRFLDILYLRQGRALSQIQFGSLNDVFDIGGKDLLAQATIDRLFQIGV